METLRNNSGLQPHPKGNSTTFFRRTLILGKKGTRVLVKMRLPTIKARTCRGRRPTQPSKITNLSGPKHVTPSKVRGLPIKHSKRKATGA